MKAIILCAGIGERFRPVSLARPKPLVPINGLPLVEYSLRILRRNNINDITMIVGHMREAFNYLVDAYGVSLVYNSRYAEANNNTSLALVRDRLDGTLIIDGDLFFQNERFLSFDPSRSHIISQPTTVGLEWRLQLDANKRIIAVDKWQTDGFGMAGVSYWTGEAARMLAKELENCAPDEYWEDAALRIFPHTPVYAVCHKERFVREMDTVKDALDFHLITHEEVAELCSVTDFTPAKLKGLTNNTWLISPEKGNLQALRVPGEGTEKFIQRDREPAIIEAISDMRITPPTVFYPSGLKTTNFLSEHRITDFRDLTPPYFAALSSLLHKMHSVPHTAQTPFPPMSIVDEIALYEHTASRATDAETKDWLKGRAEYFDALPPVLCHRDLLLENILIADADGKDMQIIDFEYAGYTCYLWDLASFILEAGLSAEKKQQFVDSYGLADARQHTELLHMEILVDYIWGLWGFTNNYMEYGENRLHRMRKKMDAI